MQEVVLGVGRREAQRAAADRADGAAHQREAVRRALLALGVERQVEEQRLDVGTVEIPRVRAKRWPCSGWSPGSGGGTGRLAVKMTGREQVVVEVLPDAPQIDERLDAEAAVAIGRPDAREQEQPRRLDRPGADDDLVPRPRAARARLRGRTRRRRSACPRRPGDERARTVCSVSCGLPSTGRRNASATLWRRPSRIVSWQKPTPSSSAPLWSSLNGMPASCAAATAAAVTGCGS